MSSSYKVKKYIAKLSKEKSPKKINAYCKKIMKYNKSQSGGADRPWEAVGNPKLEQLEAIKGITEKLQEFAETNKGRVDAIATQFATYKDKVKELGDDFAEALKYLKRILDGIPDGGIDTKVLSDLAEKLGKLQINPDDIKQGDALWGIINAPPAPVAEPAVVP